MKKYKNNFYFNMVEIVLALSVIALAIVSLMGVLPVALRAGKTSVENNKLQAVQFLMKAYIDSYYKTYKAEVNSANPNKSFKENFLKNFYNKKARGSLPTTPYDFDDESKLKLPGTASEIEHYAFRILGIDHPDTEVQKGIFLVEFFSGEYKNNKYERVDAAYDVRLWYEPFNGLLNIPYNMPFVTELKNGSPEEFKKNILEIDTEGPNDGLEYGCTFYVEISHPSGSSYDKQEHKLYKYDYFRSVD